MLARILQESVKRTVKAAQLIRSSSSHKLVLTKHNLLLDFSRIFSFKFSISQPQLGLSKTENIRNQWYFLKTFP